MPGIIARKIGMTQMFREGTQLPVTVLAVAPNIVVGKHDNHVVLAVAGSKHINKPTAGMLKKAGVQEKVNKFKGFDWLVRHSDGEGGSGEMPEIGKRVTASLFIPGQMVTVTATSKGKGFAGTVKRHGFSRGPETHGSNNVRQPGSIGPQEPQRVIKGRRMGGHMGHATVTVHNLEVLEVDAEKNLLAVRGSVPGPARGIVYIKQQVTDNK